MKQLLIILFVPMFALGQVDNCQPALKESLLKGNLEYKIERFYNEEGKIASKLETRSISGGTYSLEERYNYNEKGYLSSVSTFQNDELRFEKVLKYNNLGQLISEEQKRPGEANPIIRVSVLANQNEKLFYEQDGSVSGREVVQKYTAGKTVLKEIRGQENQLYHSEEYEYTPAGKMLSSKNVDVLGKITEERFWEYNDQNQLVRDSTLVNNSLQNKTEYQYNNTGGLVKRVGKTASGETEYEIQYSLNASDQVTTETYVYKGNVNSIKRYEYAAGKKTKEEQFNADGELLRVITWQYNCN